MNGIASKDEVASNLILGGREFLTPVRTIIYDFELIRLA